MDSPQISAQPASGFYYRPIATLKEYSKVAAVSVLVIAASTLAFYNPIQYMAGLTLLSLPLAYCTSHTVLTDSSAERINRIIAISIGIVGISLTGLSLGLAAYGSSGIGLSLELIKGNLPYIGEIPYELLQYYISWPLGTNLLSLGFISGALGVLPFAKKPIDNALTMLEKPLPETLIRWSKTPKYDRNPQTLEYYRKMIFFFNLASSSTTISSENTRKLLSIVRGELQEGEKRQSSFSERLQKIDEVAAKVFYQLFIKFASLASLIGGYHDIVPGFVVGFAYPMCNFISRGYLSKCVNFVLSIPQTVDIALGPIKDRLVIFNQYSLHLRLILYPFYRRNSFRTDDSSQKDVQNFVNADAFGRMRMLSWEALLGGFQVYTHGGLIRSFQIGKEFSEGLADKFYTRVATSFI